MQTFDKITKAIRLMYVTFMLENEMPKNFNKFLRSHVCLKKYFIIIWAYQLIMKKQYRRQYDFT